jgi:hypothetical protein
MATAGFGVVAAGLGEPTRTGVTAAGEVVIVAAWVAMLTYIGLAITSALLLSPTRLKGSGRVAVGLVLCAMAVFQIEGTFRPLEASAVPLGPALRLARLASWLALTAGVTVVCAPSQRRRRTRLAAIGVGGFLLLLASHILALLLAGRILPDTVGAALTDGLFLAAFNLSAWLLLFAVWQVVEGLHAAVDVSRPALRRLKGHGVVVLLASKLAVVVIGLALLPPAAFPDWDRVRSEGPLSWAYAIVVAGAVLTWLRAPVGPAVTARAVAIAGLVVLAVWQLPALLGFSVNLLGFFALVGLPTSLGDLASYVLLGLGVVIARTYVRGIRSIPIAWWLLFAAAVIGALVVPQTIRIGGWVATVEAVTTARLLEVADWVGSSVLAWQAWALLGLLLGSLLWLHRTERFRLEAIGVLAIGIWVLPRALTILTRDVLALASPVSAAPSLLTLDISMTFAAAWVVGVHWLRNRTMPEHSDAIGMVVLIVTVVTYGIQLGGPVLQWVADRVGPVLGVQAAALVFVVSLVGPAAYTVLFDATELNRTASTDRVLTLLGLFGLVLVVAVLLISADVMRSDDVTDDFLRSLILPGLAAVTALAFTRSETLVSRSSRPLTNARQT